MRKKIELNEQDKELFRSAMRDVKTINHTKITPPAVKVKKRTPAPTEKKELFDLYDEETPLDITGDQMLEFHRGGLQHKVLRKLRRGQYNIEATLDMHGMRVNEARKELDAFLRACLTHGARHVLIIHGKGHGTPKPILKNKLNHWLRQLDFVLAFCSAAPQDGRSGAVYVLLKGSFTFDE